MPLPDEIDESVLRSLILRLVADAVVVVADDPSIFILGFSFSATFWSFDGFGSFAVWNGARVEGKHANNNLKRKCRGKNPRSQQQTMLQ